MKRKCKYCGVELEDVYSSCRCNTALDSVRLRDEEIKELRGMVLRLCRMLGLKPEDEVKW